MTKAAFVGFGEVNTPIDIIIRKCEAAAKGLENEGLTLTKVYPVTDDYENPYVAYLKITTEAVVTSGSYQRFYTVDGQNYHHIIDPDTLMPAQGYLSVSTVCDDSGLGDALSTALFCMTKEEGLKLIESLSGVEAMWVTETNEKFFSSGWSKYEKRE
jgi:thiamine biosynthesis lipoprotein